MAFPTSFVSTATVRLPDPSACVGSTLHYLHRTLRDYGARISLQGEDFFEFRVPILDRLVNDFGTMGYRMGPWTPLTFVSAGSVSVRLLRDSVIVSADVQVGQYLLTRAAPLSGIAGLVSPVGGLIPSLVFGAGVGLSIAAIFYGLARWEFGRWLKGLGLSRQIGPPLGRGLPTGGRLTSA